MQLDSNVLHLHVTEKNRVVIVPRNKRSIPKGTLSSIWRQAGITKEIAENIWTKRQI
jgi:hypothetical protein